MPESRDYEAWFRAEDGQGLEELEIPTEAGRGFRFDVGHRSDLKPATIPI